MRPERHDLRPERPDLRLERPDLRSEGRDAGGDEKTNEQTDGRTKVPLCSTGLRPPQGRWPKSRYDLPLLSSVTASFYFLD